MEPKFSIKEAELRAYLKNHKWIDFDYPNGTIRPAILVKDSIDESFNAKNISSEQYVFLGQPYLCDALGGDLSVLICTNRKFKLPTGRVINAAYHSTIIDDTRKTFGDWLNGYWAIPPQFITYPNVADCFKYEIAKTVGFIPTDKQRNQWLNEFAKQNNAEITTADKLQFDFEADKQMLEGLIVKVKGKNEHIGAIFCGTNENEKRWNMLESILNRGYAKFNNNKIISTWQK